jgi:alkylhydroperoxidase family enzyme
VQPRDKAERDAVAHRCCSTLEITMPLLVDDIHDRVGHAYSGMPDRLYLIDPDGKVVYKGGRGPFGFKTGEMEQALVMLLLDLDISHKKALGRVTTLDDEDTWKRLPATEPTDEPQATQARPLPSWARAFAGTLPRTTAVMLELDYLHRVQSPLDPLLRGRLRWVAAHANHCGYSEAVALADLRRAGMNEAAARALEADDFRDLPSAEREALAFARKMTLAADSVTDEEVAHLLSVHGERQVAAMVLLLAYANFQDRLLLALNLPLEGDGPIPPVAVKFVKKLDGSAAPRPRQPQFGASPEPSANLIDAEWRSLDAAALQQAMAAQRMRQPRIPVPAWDDIRPNLPAWYPANRPSRIRWSLVCLGYQPELSANWLLCLKTFADEAKQDRVLEESIFWVITRAVHCFY